MWKPPWGREGLKDERDSGADAGGEVRRTCKRSRKVSSQRERLNALLSETGEGDATRREQE